MENNNINVSLANAKILLHLKKKTLEINYLVKIKTHQVKNEISATIKLIKATKSVVFLC